MIGKPTMPPLINKRRPCKYPWRDMKVGDTFLFKPDTGDKKEMRSYQQIAGTTARNFCRKSPDCKKWRFTTKRTKEGIVLKRIK